MKIFILSVAISLFGLWATAQTAEDSIKTVVNNMFDAMRNGDKASLISCFADSAILQTIIEKDGKITIKTEPLKEFADFVATVAKNDADERITFDVIKTDGTLAIVWTPYKFYYKGSFSHCGTDAFQLVKINGNWKIQYLIDTRRKTGCD